MAALIPKVNATTGSATAPGTSALVVGELAENKYTGRLYVKTESAAVVDPARVTLSGDATGSTATATSEAQAGTIPVVLNTVAVAKGGTGVTATPTNGQLLIGNGTGYTLATLTQGTGVTITNAGGSITISAATSAAPAGQIITYAGTTPPTGYLTCPTAATNVSRSTYATLFAAIGTTWGAGDGSTTFGIPYFAADNVPLQANSNVGTLYNGQNLSHSHQFEAGAPTCCNTGRPVWQQATYLQATITTTLDGGTQNLAAGRRVLHCVKY
jgi:hypothetical protein